MDISTLFLIAGCILIGILLGILITDHDDRLQKKQLYDLIYYKDKTIYELQIELYELKKELGE